MTTITSPFDDITFDEFYQYLEPELPKCPRPLILSNLRNVISDFFRLTQAWTYDIPSVNLIKDQVDYEMTNVPDCSLIDTINTITIWTTQQDRDTTTNPGTQLAPRFGYTMVNRETFRLINNPVENVTDGLEVNVILRPRRNADAIPCRLFEDYYQTITYGVLLRLMVMKGKAWSSPETASMYSQMWQNGIGVARVQINKNFMNTDLTANSPYKFA